MPTDVRLAAAAPAPRLTQLVSYRYSAIAMAVLAAGSMALAILYRPYVLQGVIAVLPPEAVAKMTTLADERIFRYSAIGALIVPFATVTFATLGSYLVLASGLITVSVELTFGAAAWASIALLLRDLTRWLILARQGLSSITAPEDVAVGLGLGFLVENHRSLSYDLLELVNSFDVVYLLVFAALLNETQGIRPRTALLAAAVPWLLMQSVRLGFNQLFFY
jgi:hypothetical protein